MNTLRFVLVGLALALFAALGWRGVARNPPLPPTAQTAARAAPAAPAAAPPPVGIVAAPTAAAAVTTPDAARTREEEALRAAPDLARAFDDLRTLFPAVADETLSSAAETLHATGQATSPDDLLAGAVRALRLRSGVLAAKAGPDALGALFDSKAAILAELARVDPRVCADFLYGGTSPEYADFAAGHRLLEAQAATAVVKAVAEGQRIQTERAPPSAEDFSKVEAGLSAKGLSAGEIAALLDGAAPDPPLPDDRLCANARTYLTVLRDLPEDARTRVYGLAADLLARS